MSTLNIHRVNVLPATLAPHSLYIVKTTRFGLAEIIFTTSDGTPVKSIDTSLVESLIEASLKKVTSLEIVPNLAARDALFLDIDAIVYVLDATGDPTITSGGALYGYKHSSSEFTLLLATGNPPILWEDIQGAPNSSPQQIDEAVEKAHTHYNYDILDQLSESDGKLHFRGQPIATVHIGLIDW